MQERRGFQGFTCFIIQHDLACPDINFCDLAWPPAVVVRPIYLEPLALKPRPAGCQQLSFNLLNVHRTAH